jgi:hypothetical protein
MKIAVLLFPMLFPIHTLAAPTPWFAPSTVIVMSAAPILGVIALRMPVAH